MGDYRYIEEHIRKYKNIFILLLMFTGLTVIVSYINFSLVAIGIFVGLVIAFTKGYLVAANFMHLNDEKQLIYMILLLAVLCLLILMFIPLLWDFNSMGVIINDHSNHMGGHH